MEKIRTKIYHIKKMAKNKIEFKNHRTAEKMAYMRSQKKKKKETSNNVNMPLISECNDNKIETENKFMENLEDVLLQS